MSAMLNLLPKIPQNILTQNCFYYNILQLLFPFWHVFSAFFAIFPVKAICLPLVWRMCFVLILCRILQELTGTFRTRHNTDSALFRADMSQNYLLEKLQKTSSSRRQNVRQNLRKTPDRLQKIARWQHCTKKCKKSKKCHTRLLSTAPPLPQKRKQNHAQKFRQIFCLLQFPEKQR